MLLSKVIKSNSEKVKSRLDIACWMLIILNSHQDIPHLEAAAWLQGPWQPPPGRKDFPPSPRVCNEHTTVYCTVLYCTGSVMNTLHWLLCTLGLWQSRVRPAVVCLLCVLARLSTVFIQNSPAGPPPAGMSSDWSLEMQSQQNIGLCLFVFICGISQLKLERESTATLRPFSLQGTCTTTFSWRGL